MDATQLRDAVIARMDEKAWSGARQVIEQYAEAVGPGVARWLEAWRLVTMDVRQVHNAAALFKEALPLLNDSPGLQAQALLVAAYVAHLARDTDWHGELAAHMRRLTNDSSPDVAPWHGRLMNLQAEFWRGPGRNLTKAEAVLRASLDWHHRNIGPFHEADRRCHMRHALVALAEVHLTRGQRAEAGGRAREAERFLGKTQGYTLLHLQGLIAEADHRNADAINLYQQAWADAREVSDWVAATDSAAAYGRILRRLQEWDKLRETLRPLVTELIEAGLPSEAHRLQLLAVPSSGEEDKLV